MRKYNNIDSGRGKILKNAILVTISIAIMVSLVIVIKIINDKQREDQKIIIQQGAIEEENARIEAAIQASKKSIVINEIHYSKDEVWVELYNPSNYEVNLTNYSLFENDNKILFVVPDDTLVSPKEFVSFSLYGNLETSDIDRNLLLSGASKLHLHADDNSIIDTVYVPTLLIDESYGRQEDGVMAFQYMSGTRNSSNAAATIIAKEYPVFSSPSGFYDEVFNLEIAVAEGYEVYYTTDGSVPTENSERYLGPIQINDASGNNNKHSARVDISTYSISPPKNKVDKATIIRAIAVSKDGSVSDVMSATYFVGYKNKSGYNDIPIISIMTDEENLFNYWDGIYVLGSIQDDVLIRQSSEWRNANYWMDWQKEAYIQYFESDGLLSFEGNINLSTFNDIMLNQPQKSFKISNLSSEELEQSTLNRYIPDLSYEADVILSAGRYDMFLKLRDTLIQEMMNDRDVLTSRSSICAVFLDGEYWGLYSLRNDYNEDYIATIYGIEADDIVIAKNGQVTSGREEDQALYDELLNFITENEISENDDTKDNKIDFSSDDAYCLLENMIDIQSFIDCYCSMIYTANNEWLSGNVLMWRTRTKDVRYGKDGLWRWMLYETDKSSGVDTRSIYRMNTFKLNALYNDSLFTALMKNEVFRKRFIISFMDIVNNNFAINKVNEFLDKNTELYRLPVITSYKRFYGSGTVDLFNSEVDRVREFYANRMDYMEKYIQSTFNGVGDLVSVNFIADTNKCKIRVNTSYPELNNNNSWNGKYFNGYDIEVEALGFRGSTFDHWELVDCTTDNELTQSEILICLSGDNPQVKAIFR